MELFCDRLISALFNGGYQGLLLTGCMWLGLKPARRTNAATRHAVWFATLLIVAALPVVHFLLPPGNPQPAPTPDRSATASRQSLHRAPGTTGADSAAPQPPASEGSRPDALDTPVFPRDMDLDRFAGAPGREGEAAHVAAKSLEPIEAATSGLMDRLDRPAPEARPRDVASAPLTIPAGPSAGPASRFDLPFTMGLSQTAWAWPMPLPEGAGRALVGLWMLLAALRMVRLAREFVGLHAFKHRAAVAPDHLRAPFDLLTTEMGVRRPTRLLLCPGRQAPMVVGFRHPVVLLPEKLVEGVPSEQIQQVLRHELAHVGRGDDWANLVQQVIKAVLFYHPAVWWLSRRLTLEREVACDDHVLAGSRTPRAYALFLTEFAGRMQNHRLAAAPAAWTNQSQLKERIAMILDSQRNASPRLASARVGILTLATTLIAAGALVAAPRLALAAARGGQDPQEPRQVSTEEEFDVSTSVSVQVDAGTVEMTVTDEALPGAAPSQTAPARIISAGSPGPSAGVASSGPRMKTPPRMTLSHAPTPAPVAVTLPTPVPPPGAPAPALVLALPHPSPAPLPAPDIAVNVHSIPAPPHTVLYAQAPGAGQPAPPPPGRSLKGASDSSVERRLERLERMMEELLAHRKEPQLDSRKELAMKFDSQFDGMMSDELSAEFQRIAGEFNKEKFAKLSAELGKIAEKAAKSGVSESDVARIKDQVRRDVERAVQDVERAATDAERSAKEAASAKAEHRPHPGMGSHPLHTQRSSLEARRKALEKQLEAVERQLEQIESEQEILDERHDELHEDDPPPIPPTSPGPEKPEGDETAPKRKPSTQ